MEFDPADKTSEHISEEGKEEPRDPAPEFEIKMIDFNDSQSRESMPQLVDFFERCSSKFSLNCEYWFSVLKGEIANPKVSGYWIQD